MIVIPAIDIIDGKCVRLTEGDYQQKKVYDDDPVAVAHRFAEAGLMHLHVVDLDGARSGHIVNQRTLAAITHAVPELHVDFGGGLKTDDDLRIAFECGARQITGGTIAVRARPRFEGWLARHGSERIILGADVRDGFVAVSGWQESSELELFAFLRSYVALGIEYVICTDISRDGRLEGSAQILYAAIRQEFPDVKLIASGGVSSLDDLKALRRIGCYAAIVGKAIYEGQISLAALRDFSESAN